MQLARALALAVVVAGTLACKKGPDPAEEAKKLTPTSTDDATKTLVDDDYRFTLAWPGAGWKVLREPDARRLNGDAVAALLHERVMLLVIVESLPGAELPAYTQLILDTIGAADKHSEVTTVTVDGHDESRVVVTGAQDGRPVTIRGRVFVYQGHGYQVLTVQMGDAPPAAVAEQALAAFALTDGPVRERSDATPVGDLDGLGWRLRGDRLEHGPARLAVTVPSSWRVVPASELARMNGEAAFGLKTKTGGGYLTVITEPVVGVDADAYVASRQAVALAQWTAVGDPVELRIGGRPVRMVRSHGLVGFAAEMLWGAAVVDGRGYQFSIWYPEAGGATLRPMATAALAAIEFLGRARSDALVAELAAAPDHQNVVGVDFALRDGVYQDFTQRLRWRRPPGLWRITVGDDARAINAAVQLQAEDLTTGLYVQLIAEPWSGDLAALERALRSRVDHPTAAGDVTVAGWPARYLESTMETASMRLRRRTTLVVADGRAVQVIAWSLIDGWPGDAAVAAVAAQLELPDAVPATELGPPFREHRYGFAVAVPAGWTEASTGFEVGPAGVLRRWTRGGSELVVIAIYAPGPDDGLMLGVVEQLVRQRMAQMVDVHPSRAEVTLAGVPASRLTWATERGRAEVHLVRRDATVYGVLAFSPEGDAAISVGRAALTLL
ncbi:MAG: hypothetical protein IPL61_34555 [Myxococcales bacterium]|nr:hypothetical protein [Myxococcales bacterium]